MKRVKILKDCYGSEDGFTVRYFRAGEVHDLADNLVAALWQRGGNSFASRTSAYIEHVGDALSADETRNRPFRDCTQNPATTPEAFKEPTYQSACLYDAIYGTDKAAAFQREGSGI